MDVRYTRIGELGARVVLGPSTPQWVVVLCHGYGAPGTDLVPLGAELIQRNAAFADKVAFVFPEAPHTLPEYGGDARAWWRIDMERMIRLRHSTPAEQDQARDEAPEGLSEARRQLRGLLDTLGQQWKLPVGRFVLGGFSQGAMLAADVTWRLEEPPAMLTLLSGGIVHRQDWVRRAAARRGLTVLQSHGQSDDIIPFSEALLLRDVLVAAGLNVAFVPFAGPHTIAEEALVRFSALLQAQVLSR